MTAASCLAIALAIVAVSVSLRSGRARRGILSAPVMLDRHGPNWGRAPVYTAPLLVRYRDMRGRMTESVIHPKNIQGRQAFDRRVYPTVLNAFCESRGAIYSFNFEGILWAADAQSNDFIDDLYTYLGNAQPGGALAPVYEDGSL